MKDIYLILKSEHSYVIENLQCLPFWVWVTSHKMIISGYIKFSKAKKKLIADYLTGRALSICGALVSIPNST